jgi:SanA protein
MKKKAFLLIVFSILFFFVFSFWANYKIEKTSEAFIFDNVSELPEIETGLLLGTSKVLANGTPNQYFQNRIHAAIELFEAKKIKYIIISGDNSREEYNEPLDMKNELLLNGIPDSVIYLDYAGFRTFDSVIRSKKIFGQHKIISISQKFHNQRSVFIARKNDIEAYGYNAKDVDASIGFKTNLREFFARTKVFFDQLINREPKFLGEKVILGK